MKGAAAAVERSDGVPPAAAALVRDALAAGHTVDVKCEDDRVSVNVIVNISGHEDRYHAAWWPYRGAMRFRYGTDGWGPMSLTAIRSFVT